MMASIFVLLMLQNPIETPPPAGIFAELAGLADLESFIDQRDQRIEGELKKKYEQIQRSGIPVDGFEVGNGHIRLHGNQHPELIKIQDPLYLLWGDFRDEDIYTVRELIARGFPAIELKVLSEAFRGEYDYRTYFDSRFQSRRADKGSPEMSDEEIRARIILDEFLKKVIDRDWAVAVLSPLSNQARRVVVSYIFEAFVPNMGRSYFMESSDGWVAAFRANIPNEEN